MAFREAFRAGAMDMAPLLPAGAIIGAVTGIAATATGLPALQAVGMGLVVYYPSVMLTAFALLDAATPGAIIVLTGLVVAARTLLYSLSLAPHFERLSAAWKWFLAYFLLTPVYAFSIQRYELDPPASKRGYYLGTAVPLWLTIQLSVLAGVVFGAGVPAELELEFVIPLAFIALAMRFVEDTPTIGAAGMGAGLAVALAAVIPNLGVLVAALGGTAVGVALSRGGDPA